MITEPMRALIQSILSGGSDSPVGLSKSEVTCSLVILGREGRSCCVQEAKQGTEEVYEKQTSPRSDISH